MSKDHTLCHFCFYNAIEDEAHFVLECPLVEAYTLVENIMKKNRSRFPIVILLTTLICNR
jgi:hypothetical protein